MMIPTIVPPLELDKLQGYVDAEILFLREELKKANPWDKEEYSRLGAKHNLMVDIKILLDQVEVDFEQYEKMEKGVVESDEQ